MEEQKKKYRLKAGYTHGLGDTVQPGDIVELTAAEFAGLRDKFEEVLEEAVEDPPAKKKKEAA